MTNIIKKMCLALVTAATLSLFTTQTAQAVSYSEADLNATMALASGMMPNGESDNVDITLPGDLPWCGRNSKGCKEQPSGLGAGPACDRAKGSECADTGTTNRGAKCQCCDTLLTKDINPETGKPWKINCNRLTQ